MRKVIIAAFFLGILLFQRLTSAPALDIIERPIFTLDPCLFATATVDVNPPKPGTTFRARRQARTSAPSSGTTSGSRARRSGM
ncbi:MAG: hypothetical protein MZV70_00795 [Desulfobacterales bacterium]|nr:hypothetical protein [Desulfobacterales bacterium]